MRARVTSSRVPVPWPPQLPNASPSFSTVAGLWVRSNRTAGRQNTAHGYSTHGERARAPRCCSVRALPPQSLHKTRFTTFTASPPLHASPLQPTRALSGLVPIVTPSAAVRPSPSKPIHSLAQPHRRRIQPRRSLCEATCSRPSAREARLVGCHPSVVNRV
jgi:hypothetical protein